MNFPLKSSLYKNQFPLKMLTKYDIEFAKKSIQTRIYR